MILLNKFILTLTKNLINAFRQCFVTAAVGSNIIGHGCAIGYPGVLLPQLDQPDSNIRLTLNAASWIGKCVSVG